MINNILHPDYWVEVPAGEFLTDLSDTQRLLIGKRIREQVNYEEFSTKEQSLVENIVTKMQQRAERAQMEGKLKIEYPLGLSEDEGTIRSIEPFRTILDIEHRLLSIPAQTSVWLDRFYIARFPITRRQYNALHTGSLSRVRGALHEPYFEREVAVIPGYEGPQKLCEQLGARLPTKEEWEKTARGTDGRLYPWGDDWDAAAGYFYYGQRGANLERVDAFPRGVSPYGAWTMAGGLPELVRYLESQPHILWKGCHARESSPEMAWFDHIIAKSGEGQWVSLRPALDQWPKQQWLGFQAGLDEPNAEKGQKMGFLADLVITQFDWIGLVDKDMRSVLEPAIIALRDGKKVETLAILTGILKQDNSNEPAWLLKTAALDDLIQQRDCIQRVLALNPNSEVGQKMAAILKNPARLPLGGSPDKGQAKEQ